MGRLQRSEIQKGIRRGLAAVGLGWAVFFAGAVVASVNTPSPGPYGTNGQTRVFEKNDYREVDFSHQDFIDFSVVSYKRIECLLRAEMGDTERAFQLFLDIERDYKGTQGLARSEWRMGLNQNQLLTLISGKF